MAAPTSCASQGVKLQLLTRCSSSGSSGSSGSSPSTSLSAGTSRPQRGAWCGHGVLLLQSSPCERYTHQPGNAVASTLGALLQRCRLLQLRLID